MTITLFNRTTHILLNVFMKIFAKYPWTFSLSLPMSQLNSLGRLVGLSLLLLLLLLVYKSWCVSCFSWLVFTAPIDVLLSRSLQFPYISGLHTNTVHMLYSFFFSSFTHSLLLPHSLHRLTFGFIVISLYILVAPFVIISSVCCQQRKSLLSSAPQWIYMRLSLHHSMLWC